MTVEFDPILHEVCAANSVILLAVAPNRPAIWGGEVVDNKIHLEFVGSPTRATISVRGVRKGFEGIHFPPASREEMEANDLFWSTPERLVVLP